DRHEIDVNLSRVRAAAATGYHKSAATVRLERGTAMGNRVEASAEVDPDQGPGRFADWVDVEVVVVRGVEPSTHQAAVARGGGDRRRIGVSWVDDAVLPEVGNLPLVEFIGSARRGDDGLAARIYGDILEIA